MTANIITSKPATLTGDELNLQETHQAFKVMRYHETPWPEIPEAVLRNGLEAATADQSILASDLHFDMHKPCDDCPFVKSSAFHGGIAASMPGYSQAIDDGIFAHTCHKTDPRAMCDGPRPQGAKVQHCFGAIVMLLKSGKGRWMQSPLMKAWAENKIDLPAIEAQAKADRTVWTLRGMLGFYLREIKKRLGRGE